MIWGVMSPDLGVYTYLDVAESEESSWVTLVERELLESNLKEVWF